MADAKKGREERRESDKGKTHWPDLHQWYRFKLPPVHPADYSIELHLDRPRDHPFRLDKLCDQLQWDDEQNVMTGSAVFHYPDASDPSSLPIQRGLLLKCRIRWDGHKYDLWTMRILAPQFQLDQGTVSVTLQDDLALLKEGAQDWYFRKTKAHPDGYTADEITRLVCKRIGLKVGRLAKATQKQSIVKRDSSAYDVLFAAWTEEHKHSKESYIMRFRHGRLQVVTLQRNPLLYTLGRELQTAQITSKKTQTAVTTVLTGRGTVGKGKGSKKVTYTDYDRRVVARLGYVHNTKNYGSVKSWDELRRKVKRDLAKMIKPDNTISVTTELLPFVRRGDGVEIGLPNWGYHDRNAFVYCQRASHSIQAATATSSFDFIRTDYYRSLWGKEDKALRARARKRRHRHRHLRPTGGVGV